MEQDNSATCLYSHKKTGINNFEIYAGTNKDKMLMLLFVLDYDKDTGIFADDYVEAEYTASELRRELQRTAKWLKQAYPEANFTYKNGEEGQLIKDIIREAEGEEE